VDHRRKPIGWEEAGVVHRVSPFPFSIRLQAPTVALRETLRATFKFSLHNASRVPVHQTRPEPIACRAKPRSSSLQIRAIHQPMEENGTAVTSPFRRQTSCHHRRGRGSRSFSGRRRLHPLSLASDPIVDPNETQFPSNDSLALYDVCVCRCLVSEKN
jgi:hypothetical protein